MKGPWQLAHLAVWVQLRPVGPSWWSFRWPQLLQRWYRVHFIGLQYPWHPGLWMAIGDFFSIALAASLTLKSRKGRTDRVKETIQVIFPVAGSAPCREGRQLMGLSLVWAWTSSTMRSAV